MASQSEQALSEVSKHFRNISERFKEFEEYRASPVLDAETLQDFFDILVELTLCTAKAIRHFRRSSIENFLAMSIWGKLHGQFKVMLDALSERLDQLRRLAAARDVSKLHRTEADLFQQLQQLSLAAPGKSAVTLCSTIPHQRNHGFFGRTVELEEISAAFEQQTVPSRIGTVAIWGMGGIGKSQVALEYAHKQ